MLRKFNESKCIDLSILSTIFVSVKFIMNKKSILFFFVLLSTSFYSRTQKADSSKLKLLNSMIDSWHANASKANFNEYFDVTTDNFVFLGTAPGERWAKSEFMNFSKPYFDKGKAWDFQPINRNWIFSDDKKVAWFDEYLNTWMNTCRGSGVVVKKNGKWMLAYYNLTVLIENEKMPEFLKLREN